jgi:pilus assembly protein CpaE
MVEAMQIGVRHFLVKESISGNLTDVLNRLMPKNPARRSGQGRMITVLSASGGCGATTVATNIAHELYLLGGEKTLLVDFDSYFGGVGTYLGLSGQYGLLDVLNHPMAIDRDLIQSTTIPYGSGLRVLLSPASTNFRTTGPLVSDRISESLSAIADAARFVVADAPRLGSVVECAMAQFSAAILIVFQLCVKDIRVAKLIRNGLLEKGIDASRIVMVANRFRKRYTMVGIEEAAVAIGDRIWRLPNDYKPATAAQNLGQLLADAAPRSALRRDIAQLASKLLQNVLLGPESLTVR